MGGISFQGWFKRDIQSPKPMSSKLVRKNLSKRLKANQLSNRYTHIMDNDMFDTVQQMFKSEDKTNNQMAKDIVWNSRLSEEQMNYFITHHPYNLI